MNLKLKVFSYDVIVAKNDAQVELELDLEVLRVKRWTGEEPRQLHINRNLNLGAHVAVGNLKILNFGGIARKAL